MYIGCACIHTYLVGILHDLFVCCRHFDAEQRDKELEIVQKLLSEERRMKWQQERLSKPHWRPREVGTAAGLGQRKVGLVVRCRWVAMTCAVHVGGLIL